MHGELLKARCVSREAAMLWTRDITPADRCPRCGDGLRPHVVRFGEMPLYMEAIESALEINLEPSGAAPFERVRAGPASREVVVWVDEVLGGGSSGAGSR